MTRKHLLPIAEAADAPVSEKPFTVAEAKAAREAFITAASTFVMPVVSIDGVRIADGRPGPVASRLRALYMDSARARSR